MEGVKEALNLRQNPYAIFCLFNFFPFSMLKVNHFCFSIHTTDLKEVDTATIFSFYEL
jgi:hypothetical protein